MLSFLNVFFLVFHTAWMVFNCVGWAWRRTRPWHLLTIALTALSWFGLGWWYGNLGYCACTDWHWQVRERLGLPNDYSYTHFLLREWTGIDAPASLTDAVTGGVFAVTVLHSVVLNLRDFLRRSGRPQAAEKPPQ
jgi:hypothetical protein